MTTLDSGNGGIKVVRNRGCISTDSTEGMKLSKGDEKEWHNFMAFNSDISPKVRAEDLGNRCKGGKK